MKIIKRISPYIKCLVLAAFMIPGVAGAASPSPSPVAAATGTCETILAICKSRGFYPKGKPEHKGLYADCFYKIVSGASVPGVNIGPNAVKACQDQMKNKVPYLDPDVTSKK